MKKIVIAKAKANLWSRTTNNNMNYHYFLDSKSAYSIAGQNQG